MTFETSDQPRYYFGPIDSRGLIAGLSASQVLLLSVGLIGAVVVFREQPSPAGFLVALAVLGCNAATAFMPVAGRPLHEWGPLTFAWAVKRVRRHNRYRSALPLLGVGSTLQTTTPPAVDGVEILRHPTGGGADLGVVHDHRRGTYSAVLAVRGRSFELASTDEKLRRLDAWGALLAGLGRASSPIYRLQWIERTAQDDGEDLQRYLTESAQLIEDHPARRSYEELIGAADPACQPHEVLLVATVSALRSRRAIKSAGGADLGACTVLERELGHLRRDLASAEIVVDRTLDPFQVAAAMRYAFEPRARGRLARCAGVSAQDVGSSPVDAWPLAADTGWSFYRSEDAWHATYWVAQWPRMPVGPDFLAHLLAGTTATRSVSLTMEPIPPARAHREVENALVQGMADDELRARAGFMGTARRRREREAVARREEELASGHADYRMSGYVTVTATGPDELEHACGEVEQAAERSRLQLRRMYGEQDVAFTYTLPLGRGLS